MNKSQAKQLLRHVSLRQLQIFDAIERLGSFTGAAKELYITQPTVSFHADQKTGTQRGFTAI